MLQFCVSWLNIVGTVNRYQQFLLAGRLVFGVRRNGIIKLLSEADLTYERAFEVQSLEAEEKDTGTLKAVAKETSSFQDKPFFMLEKKKRLRQTHAYETSLLMLSMWWRIFSNSLSTCKMLYAPHA